MTAVPATENESNKPKVQLDLGILEEDDDFEEFPVDEWAGKAEDTEEVSLWEDNWDDDIVEEEFSTVLRAEFEKQGRTFVLPEIAPAKVLQNYIDHMPEDESSDKPETSDDDSKYPSPTPSVRGPAFSSPLVLEETHNVGDSPIKRETTSPQIPVEAPDSTLAQSDLFLGLPTAPTSFIDSSTLTVPASIKLEAPSNRDLSGEAWAASQRVSWNGETWTIEASDEENPFSDSFSSSSTSDTEPEVSRRESAARASGKDQDFTGRKTADVDSFTDSDVDDPGKRQTTNRSALDQKAAQAIACKYRQDRLRKTIKAIQGDRPTDLSSLLPGALVWTLLPNRFNLPWWPGVVVARPVKKKSAVSSDGKNGPAVVEENNIRYFRVLLLCSASLPVEASMWLPQHRLRPFYGRAEFELFMRSQLANLKNKIKAIRHFAVAPKHQAFWHAARDQADAALTSLGKSLTSRFRFLGVHLPTLQAAWKAEDRKRKEALRQKQIEAASAGKNLHVSDGQNAAKFSTASKKQPTEGDMRTTAAAEQTNKLQVLPKDDSFAFELLTSQNHLPAKGQFICCVCLKPGHLPVKLKEKSTEKVDNKEKTGKKTLFLKKANRRGAFRFPPMLLNRPLNLKTVKPANPVKRMQRQQQQQKAKRANRTSPSCPLLVPCSGRCSHFLHVDCINQVAPGNLDQTGAPASPLRTKAFCFFCRAGLRQCSICMGVQPIACGTHCEALEHDATEHHSVANSEPDTDAEGVSHSNAKLLPPMQVCSVSHCRRWFHSTCLRQQPFAALVRDGRAATFTCPAHTCMSCFADAPGTLPRPSSVFIRCYLCAATYHPGGWCVPAGSLELSEGWIICPRHALQSPPVIPVDDLKLPATDITSKKDQRSFGKEIPVEGDSKVGSLQERITVLSLPAASSQETKSKPEYASSDAKLQADTTRCLEESQPSSSAEQLDSMKESTEDQSTLKGSPKRINTAVYMNDHSVEKMEATDSTTQPPDVSFNSKCTEDRKLTELNIDVSLAHTEDKTPSISLPLDEILLPEPRRSQLAGMFRPANVSWCFICSKGGRIICCESCPASFHQECLKLDEVPEQFLCEDCMNGRMPRYGEIVWARLPPTWHADVAARIEGLSSALALLRQAFPPADCLDLLLGVRWWPAEVLHDKNLQPDSEHEDMDRHQQQQQQQQQQKQQPTATEETPSSLREPSRLGFFAVRLFGLYSATPFNGVSPQAISPSLSPTPKAAPTTESNGGSNKPFPVCLWTTKARVFPYEEGDDDRQDSDQTDDSDSLDDFSGQLSDASMAEEDPMMNKSAGSLTESFMISPSTGRMLLSPSASLQGRERPLSGSGAPEGSPGSRLRRRLPPPPARQKAQSTGGSTKKRRARANLSADARMRKSVYREAVKRAALGWKLRKEKFTKHLGRTRRPDYYKPIKVNYPIGSVRLYRYTDLSEVLQCECKATPDVEPCGPNSGCINRELLYECVPGVCVHGEKCRNQRFTRREYPPQRPFWTGDERGWGLKTLLPISKGEFVNEYIGDLIDEEEANRRLRIAHENNITNYYMMQMDSQRIIDAGPKGNLSRFMNHSCEPNLFTQKWTVNGDTRVGLFAVREIAAGEELTFNYNFCAHGQEMLNCRCGAASCVGYLGARPEPAAPAHPATATSSNSGTDQLTNAMVCTDDQAASVGGGSGGGGGQAPRRVKSTLVPAPTTTGSAAGPAVSSRVGADSTEFIEAEINRHEKVCYRCGKLCADDPDGSAGSTASRSPKRRRRRRHLDPSAEEASSVTSATSTSSTKSCRVEPLILCRRSDCPKAYHLQCLELDKKPVGRWICPWHHCDACGRPATVFCMRCPAAFCPAHVEGSVTILPPAVIDEDISDRGSTGNGGGDIEGSIDPSRLPQVVCLFHSDIMGNCSHDDEKENSDGSESKEDSSDSPSNADTEDKSDSGSSGKQRAHSNRAAKRTRVSTKSSRAVMRFSDLNDPSVSLNVYTGTGCKQRVLKDSTKAFKSCLPAVSAAH